MSLENVDVDLEEMPGSAPMEEEFDIIFKPVNVSHDERELLARVVFCEAGTEGLLGMQRVCDVVLNRVYSPKFPDSITEVLMVEGQFASVERDDFYSISVSRDAYYAVDLSLSGKRVDTESLYFARKPLTQDGLYQYGRHYFSK